MKIGKYEVLETVRIGSIATLYKALDPATKTELALKTFECTDSEAVRRFQRELRARGTLVHANIAQVVKLGNEGNLVYVATEWLEGEDLGRFMARKAAMSLEDKLDFMLGICEGLVFAHENNVIHCDISLRNLFLLKAGPGKILDLGTSNFWASRFCPAKPDQAKDGFPYRAPELIADRRYDSRTDVFSAGKVFWEFLAGIGSVAQEPGKPGAAETDSKTALARLPGFLVETLEKATATDPVERYQSASEMLAALHKVIDELARQRVKMVDAARRDCSLISGVLLEIKDIFGSNWVQKRLNEGIADRKVLEKIQADSTAGVASNLPYFELTSLMNKFEITGRFLTEITAEAAALRKNVLAMQALLPETNAEQAQILFDAADDLFSSEPKIKSALGEIRVQLRIKSLNQAIVDGDLAAASRLLEEIEAAPPTQESAVHSVAAARAKLADIAVKNESLFKQAEISVDQLKKAVKQENAEQISGMLENLQYQEKNLAEQYPSSDLVAKLIERSRDTRHQGLLVLARRQCREALKDNNIKAAKKSLQKFENLCGSSPECLLVMEQLRTEIAGLEEKSAPKSQETKPQALKKEEAPDSAGGKPQVRMESKPKTEEKALAAGALVEAAVQPVKEKKAEAAENRRQGHPEAEAKEQQKASADQKTEALPKPKIDDTVGTPRPAPEQPPAKEDKASVDDIKSEESAPKSGVDVEAVRTRVANLFEENPEKCLAFLDTLDSQLIEDTVIQSFQQKSLQARKERSAEIILKKPKKRPGLGAQGKGIACPVCSTMNPIDSKFCSQCYALIQDTKSVPIEATQTTVPGVAKAKMRLRSPAESVEAPPPAGSKRAANNDKLKYYGIGLAALIVIIGIISWLANRGSSPTPGGQPEVIGSAITAVATELRDETRIIGNLPQETRLEILHKPGTSNQLNQDSEFWLPVRTVSGQSLSGTVKVGDLDQLEITGNKAYTGWHALLVVSNKFPSTDNAKDLKDYLEWVNRKIDNYSDATPPSALIKKQAVGYLSLARRAKSDDVAALCKNAGRYIARLDPSDSQGLAADYKSLCTAPPEPVRVSTPLPIEPVQSKAPAFSCDDTVKELQTDFDNANDKFENNEFTNASRGLKLLIDNTDKLLKKISKSDSCYGEIEGIRNRAKTKKDRCDAKIKAGQK
jgi:serine/threonine protein kinase